MKKINLREDITEILAVISAVGVFVVIILLFFISIPPANKDLLSTLGAIAFGLTTAAFGYYFGQSKNRNRASEPGQTVLTTEESSVRKD